MSRTRNEAPRQNVAAFDAKDARLQQVGQGSQITAVTVCNDWKLKVKVTAMVDARKPKLDMADVEVTWGDATVDAPVCQMTSDDKGVCTTIVGQGPRTGTCRATAKGWYLEADRHVTLADGDDKIRTVVLKPVAWVAFKVVDHKTDAFIESLHVKANLPVIGDQTADTLKDALLDIEHDDLRPGGTCTLLELTHDTLLYEVVGSVTTA